MHGATEKEGTTLAIVLLNHANLAWISLLDESEEERIIPEYERKGK